MEPGLPDVNASLTLDFLKVTLEDLLMYLYTIPQIRVERNVYGRIVRIHDASQCLAYKLRQSEWVNIEFLACEYNDSFIKRLVQALGCEAVQLATCDTTDYCEYTHYDSNNVLSHFRYPSDENDDDIDDGDDPWLDVDDFLRKQGIYALYTSWTRFARLDEIIVVEDDALKASDFLGIHRVEFLL